MGKLKTNIILQTVYQFIAAATPLIVSPYLSRVLGAEGLGIYSYTYSVVNYFTVFAMLGLTHYGSRTIAMAKEKKQQDTLFCEMYALQLLTSLLACLCYVALIFISYRAYLQYALIQGFWLLACLFDVTWYFFGRGEFKMTIVRNALIKVLTVLSIFVFVRDETDVSVYIFIMAAGTCLSQLSLWVVMLRRVSFSIPSMRCILSHMRQNLVLFLALLGTSLYAIAAKTMLGVWSDNVQGGYYYNVDKLIYIPLQVITGVGIILLQKASVFRAEGREEDNRQLTRISLFSFLCISIAMAFGMAAVAPEFVPLFFGEEFEPCVSLVQWSAALMVLTIFSDTLRMQYLVPYGKEKVLIVSSLVGLAVNLSVGVLCIAFLNFGALGAILGVLAANTVMLLVQWFASERELRLKKTVLQCMAFLGIGAVMFIVVRLVSFIQVHILLKIMFEIAAGGAVYCILTLLYLAVIRHPAMKMVFKGKG